MSEFSSLFGSVLNRFPISWEPFFLQRKRTRSFRDLLFLNGFIDNFISKKIDSHSCRVQWWCSMQSLPWTIAKCPKAFASEPCLECSQVSFIVSQNCSSSSTFYLNIHSSLLVTTAGTTADYSLARLNRANWKQSLAVLQGSGRDVRTPARAANRSRLGSRRQCWQGGTRTAEQTQCPNAEVQERTLDNLLLPTQSRDLSRHA